MFRNYSNKEENNAPQIFLGDKNCSLKNICDDELIHTSK